MNILDEILANQVKILALLAVSPVAKAVAEVITPVAAPVVAPVAIAAPVLGNETTVVTAPITPIVTPVVVGAPVTAPLTTNAQQSLIELDKDGLPHDLRINTKDPAKTVKHTWKAKKGAGKLDATQTEAVKSELLATVAANPAAYKPFGEVAVAPVAPVVAAPVVAPVAIAAPVVAAPVVAAPVVAAPVVAVVDPSIAAAKGEAITHVNTLTDTWKVDYDNILEVVGDFNNAKSFDELAPEYYVATAQAFKEWVEWLTACKVETDAIITMGAAAGEQGIADTCSQYGVTTIAGVHHKELPDLHAALKSYRAAWDAAVAAAQ